MENRKEGNGENCEECPSGGLELRRADLRDSCQVECYDGALAR